jgi:hypothetical protein
MHGKKCCRGNKPDGEESLEDAFQDIKPHILARPAVGIERPSQNAVRYTHSYNQLQDPPNAA